MIRTVDWLAIENKIKIEELYLGFTQNFTNGRAAIWAFAFYHLHLVLGYNFFAILDFDLSLAFHASTFHHVVASWN